MALKTKTLDGRFTLFGSTSTTLEEGVGIPILIEADGTLRSQLIGWDGSVQTRILTETDGALKEVLYGKDSGGTQRALRVSSTEGVLRNRPWEPQTVLAEGQLPSSVGTLYTVPASTTTKVKFFSAFNLNVAAQTVKVYVDASGVNRQFGQAVLLTDEHARFVDTGEELQLNTGDIIKGTTTTATAVDYVITGNEESA